MLGLEDRRLTFRRYPRESGSLSSFGPAQQSRARSSSTPRGAFSFIASLRFSSPMPRFTISFIIDLVPRRASGYQVWPAALGTRARRAPGRASNGWSRWELNPRSSGREPDALPLSYDPVSPAPGATAVAAGAEREVRAVELVGVEPTASCVPRRRSSQLSYSPEKGARTTPHPQQAGKESNPLDTRLGNWSATMASGLKCLSESL